MDHYVWRQAIVFWWWVHISQPEWIAAALGESCLEIRCMSFPTSHQAIPHGICFDLRKQKEAKLSKETHFKKALINTTFGMCTYTWSASTKQHDQHKAPHTPTTITIPLSTILSHCFLREREKMYVNLCVII